MLIMNIYNKYFLFLFFGLLITLITTYLLTINYGEFKNYQLNGKGLYISYNGDVYSGNYLNGNQNGYGVITYSSGEKFSGFFRNNLKHGKGFITNTKGKEIDVEFNNGNLLKK